jgi:osmotically-inducible protein OsmY
MATLGTNMTRLNLAQENKLLSAVFVAVSLVSVVGCAGTPQKEGTGEYVDDTLITTKVKAAIFNEPTLKSAEINVETFKGTVQLSGFVNSRADIDKAVATTRSVGGVKSVKNDIRSK